MRRFLSVLAAGLFSMLAHKAAADPCATARRTPIALKQFRVIDRESGPVNYYRIVDDANGPFIHAEYKPPFETTVLGFQVAEADRPRVAQLEWSWRAKRFPNGGNECVDGKGDSAAVVYVTWKRGLRWYTLKYVWSTAGRQGSICKRKRNPFVAQDTIILQSGGAVDVWKNERVDLRDAFRKHFEDGDPDADIPDFGGIGIMSDGDQTSSPSSADYARFVLNVDGACPK